MTMSVDGVIATYCAAWNETDPVKRDKILQEVWDDDATYTDPTVHTVGREALVAHISTVCARFPGSTIVMTSAIDVHHNVLRFYLEAGAGRRQRAAGRHRFWRDRRRRKNPPHRRIFRTAGAAIADEARTLCVARIRRRGVERLLRLVRGGPACDAQSAVRDRDHHVGVACRHRDRIVRGARPGVDCAGGWPYRVALAIMLVAGATPFAVYFTALSGGTGRRPGRAQGDRDGVSVRNSKPTRRMWPNASPRKSRSIRMRPTNFVELVKESDLSYRAFARPFVHDIRASQAGARCQDFSIRMRA